MYWDLNSIIGNVKLYSCSRIRMLIYYRANTVGNRLHRFHLVLHSQISPTHLIPILSLVSKSTRKWKSIPFQVGKLMFICLFVFYQAIGTYLFGIPTLDIIPPPPPSLIITRHSYVHPNPLEASGSVVGVCSNPTNSNRRKTVTFLNQVETIHQEDHRQVEGANRQPQHSRRTPQNHDDEDYVESRV